MLLGICDPCNLAVIHLGDPVCELEDAGIVRDDNQSAIFTNREPPHELHHLLAGFAIEGARRLVAND